MKKRPFNYRERKALEQGMAKVSALLTRMNEKIAEMPLPSAGRAGAEPLATQVPEADRPAVSRSDYTNLFRWLRGHQ